MTRQHVPIRPARTWASLAALALLACAPTTRPATETGAKMTAQPSSSTTADDLVAAIAIAERSFDQASASVGDYRLVQAQRLLAGDEHCSGTRCWRLTFKATRLIPTSLPALIGAGGELFFTVDVDRGAAKFTGHGE
jgi:hypothetical protein